MLRNVKVSKRNEYISYTRVNLRFSQVFGIFDNLPGKANVRYFFIRTFVIKTDPEFIATLQKEKCNVAFMERLAWGEVIQGTAGDLWNTAVLSVPDSDTFITI